MTTAQVDSGVAVRGTVVRPRSRKWVLAGAGAFVVVFALTLAPIAAQLGAVAPPGDAAGYDMLALNLARGRGFIYWCNDDAFWTPYRAAGWPGCDSSTVAGMTGPAPTSFRAPGLPVVQAMTYLVVGRQYWLIRMVMALATAAGAVLTVDVARRMAGAVAAGAAVALLATMDMTTHLWWASPEPLAFAWVALSLWAVVRLAEAPGRSWAILAGLAAGAAALTRQNLVVLLPALVLPVLALAWRQRSRRVAALAGLVAGVFAVVMAPWLVRNAILFGRPLGTHGAISGPACWGDGVYRTGGVWPGNAHNPAMQAYDFNRPMADGRQGIEAERAIADMGAALGRRWILENWRLVPGLAWAKVATEWTIRTDWDRWAYMLAVLGLLASWRRPGAWVSILMLLAVSAGVALTWSVCGRFLVAVWPCLIVLAATGAGAVAQVATATPRGIGCTGC
jgi:4-amino-4-deoxy-L-arabinose transferase-like glycosyltransferase